ncbi:uncharacterized protein TRAVEDRAFT_52831 [Trametes versicolor FP-101664 SS1]|uniref:uncharacterized protein n=1 Tax=Trametes versicolor (strain FP-101664) TaxID=717944 RepID=UPI0004622A39|nr:uncharacterized protein TRAVEDRAFT_52831 [Trametes versicolor FP-101664 SS1]EIW53712.1 hypothetical protein TRAVEDRAFT_52831 [Trametes versicolor FP-101664 SS1]
MCYYYLVTNYFHPETLVRGVWSMDIFSFIGGITPIVTQSMFDLVTTILAFAFPQKIIYALSGIPACKIYGITLLVTLHSRRTIREKGVSTAVQNFTASDVVFGVDVLPPQETLPVARGDTRPPSQISRMHTRHWLQYGSVMGDGPDAMELKAYGSSPLPVRGIQA